MNQVDHPLACNNNYVLVCTVCVELLIKLLFVLHIADVLEQLMNFFYTLFKHFRSQIEPGLTNEVTQTFMAFLSK